MKRTILALLFLGAAMAVQAADMKIGYVNSEAIMQQLPEAQDAQKQLDGVVAEWQGELTKMQADLQKKFDEYEQTETDHVRRTPCGKWRKKSRRWTKQSSSTVRADSAQAENCTPRRTN